MYSPSSMAQRTGAKRPPAFWYQLPALRQSTKTTLRRQPRHRAQHTAPRKTARREIPSGRSARIRDGAAPGSQAPWKSAPPRPGSARCPGRSPATGRCRTSPRSPPRTEPRKTARRRIPPGGPHVSGMELLPVAKRRGDLRRRAPGQLDVPGKVRRPGVIEHPHDPHRVPNREKPPGGESLRAARIIHQGWSCSR